MMKPIAVGQLSDNFFETISKEWMPVIKMLLIP